jgi:hypothetical protein
MPTAERAKYYELFAYSRVRPRCIFWMPNCPDGPIDGLRSTHRLRSDGGPGKEAVPELFEALNFF